MIMVMNVMVEIKDIKVIVIIIRIAIDMRLWIEPPALLCHRGQGGVWIQHLAPAE